MNNKFLIILILIIQDSLPELKRESFYCSRLASVGRLASNGI
ncbi:unnamed protein product, partial [marine sediment metagenome]